jgi:outer membrane beta-barrel protein
MHSLYVFRLWLILLILGYLGIQSSIGNAEAQGKKDAKALVQNEEQAKKQNQGSAPPTGASKDSERLNIQDLEQKYWAPKDTNFSVVQNRAYTKEKRFSGSLQYGPIINDAFNEGYNLGLKANYFWNERTGAQIEYVSFNISDNSTVRGFSNQYGGVRPNIGRVTSMWGVGYNWVPIYAKMSLLGERIIYFDMAITPTLGMMNYQKTTKGGDKSGSSIAYGFDISQYFFLNKHIAIRADLQNRWWTEEVLDWNYGTHQKTQTTNSTVFFIGVTYYH